MNESLFVTILLLQLNRETQSKEPQSTNKKLYLKCHVSFRLTLGRKLLMARIYSQPVTSRHYFILQGY